MTIDLANIRALTASRLVSVCSSIREGSPRAYTQAPTAITTNIAGTLHGTTGGKLLVKSNHANNSPETAAPANTEMAICREVVSVNFRRGAPLWFKTV